MSEVIQSEYVRDFCVLGVLVHSYTLCLQKQTKNKQTQVWGFSLQEGDLMGSQRTMWAARWEFNKAGKVPSQRQLVFWNDLPA